MKDIFLNNSISLITKYNSGYDEVQLEKMRYGLEGIYLTIEKMVVIIGLAIILGMIKEVLIILFLYNALRFFGFGFHAKTSMECLIISLSLFIILPYLSINGFLSYSYSYALNILCLLSFVLFAPADTVKRPMINKKKKLYRKLGICAIGTVFTIMSLFVNKEWNIMISLAMILQMFMVNPMFYKLFRQPYDNYKEYLKQNGSY